ncbi:MAG: aldo/keto reductase [Mogibacterium sp.]|nr:aldo/keto reductase [Mogibacterium sp.]
MGVIKSTKKFGFGLMRLPEDPEKNADLAHVDLEQCKEMVDVFLERGFTYFDAAWMYHDFKNEDITRLILTERYPRDRYTLADKLSSSYFRTEDEVDEVFRGQLRRCGVEYFDYYLLHDIGRDDYDKMSDCGCFEWLRKIKEEGAAKHIGFSCHDDPEFIERVLTEHPEMEFVQIQLNYLDWENPGIRARECYEMITRFGRPVVVMEPCKGGALANVPEAVAAGFEAHAPGRSAASWAIRFAASHENVAMVLSGMSSMEQLLDNLSFMEAFEPLSEEEQAMVLRAADEINRTIRIACTACAYCVPGCPMDIPIPKYFALYNADMREVGNVGWTPQMDYYDRLTVEHGKGSDCIGCGQCESMCPQHLPVIELLREVSERFE